MKTDGYLGNTGHMESVNFDGISEVLASVASVKDGKMLFKSIREEVYRILRFADFGLFLVDTERDLHYQILDDGIPFSPKLSRDRGHRIEGRAAHQYSGSFVKWLAKNGPIAADTQVIGKHNEHPYNQKIGDSGYKNMLGGPLKTNGETIGVLCLFHDQKDFYSEKDYPLFNTVLKQMAVAISNVLAMEHLHEEKVFNEKLLSISQAITEVNDRRQLLKTIYERIKPIFPYDGYGLFILTDDQQYHYELIDAEVMGYESSQVAIEAQYGPHHRYKHPGSSVETIMREGPDIFLLADHMHHPQVSILYESGFRQVIGGPLVYGGISIGMLCFNSKEDNYYTQAHLPLFAAIAEQVSIATAHVMANERVLEEKRFKEMLLDISESVLTIQDEKRLFRVIFEHIRPIFPFNQVGLFIKHNEDFPFLIDTDIFPESVFFKVSKETLDQEKVNGFVRAVIELNAPIIASPKELKTRFPGFPHEKQIAGTNDTSLIVGGLKTADGAQGLLGFSNRDKGFTKKDIPLFKAIVSQLSIAVSNIRHKREIQLRERTKALEAELLSAMNKGETQKDKLKALALTFQGFIPYDLIHFSPSDEVSDGTGYCFEQIGPKEHRIISSEDFLEIFSISGKEYESLLRENRYERSVLANGEDFDKVCKKDRFRSTLARGFGIDSAILVPLELSRQGTTKSTYLLALYRKGQKEFTKEEFSIIQQVKQSLAIGMERQIAYQQIKYLNEKLENEKEYLEDELGVHYNFNEIIGSSKVMQQVFEKVNLVVNADTTVLILGETGTGKELIARALHNVSNRKDNTFVKVNCATLPKELIESELFGHEKGAFTGAQQQRIGKFELANEGTIFLDEIGELPFDLQAKLLRVIQEKEFERLGGNKTIKTSARIVAATNRDLEKEVKESRFRSDLYFRLGVFPIRLPPLREREGDIEELADFFLMKYARKTGKKLKPLSKKGKQRLHSYNWPGNVRELEHIIERSVLLSSGTTLELALGVSQNSAPSSETPFVPRTLQEAERLHILQTLKLCGGKVSGADGAASILGVPASTLEYRIRRAGIEKKHVFKGE